MGWESWNDLVETPNRFASTNKGNRPATISKPTHIVIHITGTDSFNAVKNRFMNGNASAHYLVKDDGTLVQFVKDKDRAWHAGIKPFVRTLYDQGSDAWKKYLYYFDWYSYPANAKYLKADLTQATVESERKLVTTSDGSQWEHYSYWERHGSRQIPLNYENSHDPNNYSIGIELLTFGGNNSNKYPDGLYTGAAKLINDLIEKYDIPVDRSHIVGHEDVNPVERWGWDPNSGFDWDRLFELLNSQSSPFSFPVYLGSDNTLTAQTVEKYFDHTEHKHKGGYFPLGANTVWHGGLHIHTAQGSNVYAIADGEVIAVKLAESEDLANGHYGSHNFILLRHTITGKILNTQFEGQNAESEQVAASDQETHRLEAGETLQQLAEQWGTTVQQIRDANAALENAGHYGQAHSGTQSWYWEADTVIRPASASPSPGTSEEAVASPSHFNEDEAKYFYSLYMHLNNEPLDLDGNKKINKIKWLPKKIITTSTQSNDTHVVEAGEKLGDLAAEWNTTVEAIRDANPDLNFGQNSSGTISWFHPGDTVLRPPITTEKTKLDTDFSNALRTGDIVKITDTFVKSGELIWTAGTYGTKPVGMIHWEIFSEENLLTSFVTVEDNDNDYNMDTQQIFDMVEQGDDWFNDKANINADEVINFYSNNDKAKELRAYSCKFISEWAVDLNNAISKMKGRYITYGLKEKLEPYVWWPDAQSKGVSLPSDKHVWHYNPITFVSKLKCSAIVNSSNSTGTSETDTTTTTTDVTTFGPDGRQLLKQVEGVSLQPYDDQTSEIITAWVEGATIGYGHLIPINEWSLYSGGITQEQVEQLFNGDLMPFIDAVNEHVSVTLTQNQFDALVIFCYNIGATAFANSSAVALINDPNADTDYDSLEDAWKAWNKSQGQVMQGLINRRNAEWKIYSEGVYETW